MPTYKEVVQKAGKQRINNDKNHGWGVDDSLSCIIELIVNETGAEEIRDNKELVSAIRELVNPSQFRQKLETAGVLNKSETKQQKTAKITEGWS